MTLSQKIVDAIYAISEQHEFVACEEPELIEQLIEIIGLPMTGDSYTAVEAELFTDAMQADLKKIGIEFTATDMHW